MDRFSLSNHFFCGFESKRGVHLQFLREGTIPDADDESVSDHLLLQYPIVTVFDKIIEGHYILLRSLSTLLVPSVEPGAFVDTCNVLSNLEEGVKLGEDMITVTALFDCRVRKSEDSLCLFS